MMYQQLIVLLPCQSLEDFPTHHEGGEAAGLLAAWSALWHPALIACAGKIPSWYRADSPPADVTNKLVVVPGVSQPQVPTGYLQRVESESACLIQNQLDRGEMIELALRSLDAPPRAEAGALAGDFLALGYCYLQVELLTRKLRYSSNLDEIHFQNQVVAAAVAAMEGNLEVAHERLAASFDILAAERDHYYPGEAYLLDLTMLAPTTLGVSLRDQLALAATCNLLLSGELLQQMADREPLALDSLRTALQAGRVGLVGGEYGERNLSLLSCETLLNQLQQGLDQFQAVLGCRPKVYGRRRFGLTPFLPQILTKLGFDAAVHASLEDGVVPEGSQVKVRWEGCDGTPITALARLPLDAAKPQTFLNLGVKLGESMDMDHIATVCLAHWPGTPSPWYDDLRRIASYCSALGKFIAMDEYFRTTDYPVHQDRFGYDQYGSPYLKQAVARNQPDPISAVVRYWRRRCEAEAAQSLSTLAALVAGKELGVEPPGSAAAVGRPKDLLQSIDIREDGATAETDAAAERSLQQALQSFAASLPRARGAAETGCLVVNPHSFVRRVGIETGQLSGLPEVVRPVYAASATKAAAQIVADVPPLGFAWIAPGAARSKAKKAAATLADECLLRNEFFEAKIDPTSGGLRSIHEYNARHNRLSQQLVFGGDPANVPAPSDDVGETAASGPASIMAADSVETVVSTETLGEIVARGRLLDRRGHTLADYRQTYRLWRGSRVLLLDIELQPHAECSRDPWNSYYATRFAWASEAADLYRSANLTRQPAKSKRFEAPLYVEIDDVGIHTTILTGGLPFHRRYGRRMLDTLLVVAGERCRRFQIGIGVEVKNPLHESLNLVTPVPSLVQTAAAPSPVASGWLFHVDARNVTATHWEPWSESGVNVGFRVRLLETQGRQATVGLQCLRAVRTARKLNFQGDQIAECPIEKDAIRVQLTAHEWAQIEARW